MSGDGSSYSSRLSDGYISNAKGLRESKRRREEWGTRAEESVSREIKKSSRGNVDATLFSPVGHDG